MRCYKKPFAERSDDEFPYWDFRSVRSWDSLPENLYFVHVCSFRFVFTSLAQIAEYRAFYDQPRKPAFRRVRVDRFGNETFEGDTTSQFARLPLRLWQKGKREKVVAALDRAIREFAKG